MMVHGLNMSDDNDAGTASHCDGIKKTSSEDMNSLITAFTTANSRYTATFTRISRSRVFAFRNWLLIFPENPDVMRCEDMRKMKFKMERKCY
jgi:hypothetical protein